MDLGKVDLQEEMERRAEELYTPNWFSVELKTGVGGGEGRRGEGGGEGMVRGGWEVGDEWVGGDGEDGVLFVSGRRLSVSGGGCVTDVMWMW